jgi:GPI mannosyltransferase 3
MVRLAARTAVSYPSKPDDCRRTPGGAHWANAVTERRLGRALLMVVIATGLALRLWLSFNDDGIHWPDEIYQSLEPAHRIVFGYGLMAWEFVDGGRHWTFPAFCAALFKLATSLGLSDPSGYLGLTRITFSAIGVGSALGSFFLARSYGASTFPAACGAALFALAAPAIYFAPRAMSETASALPVTFGLALALSQQSRRSNRILGTSLLGFAVLLRLQNAIFCLGLLAVLAARTRRRPALEAAAVLVLWALIYGALDWLTWGTWFHSAAVYLNFNLFEKGNLWSTDPFLYYLHALWTSMRWSAVLIAMLSVVAFPRAPGLMFIGLAFFIAHSSVEHKELRFVFTVLPIFCALAGIGLDLVRSRGPVLISGLLGVAVLSSAVISAASFRNLTFGDLGEYRRTKPKTSAYDDSGPTNRLLLAGHRQTDLCGLKLETANRIWTGGYTYLHRPVPLYSDSGPPRESGLFNYVIASTNRRRGGEVVQADGDVVLLRVSDKPCLPDREYQWRL